MFGDTFLSVPTVVAGECSLPSCEHCGGFHYGKCYRIKAIDYNPDGTVKRIEYHAPGISEGTQPLQQPLKIVTS